MMFLTIVTVMVCGSSLSDIHADRGSGSLASMLACMHMLVHRLEGGTCTKGHMQELGTSPVCT